MEKDLEYWIEGIRKPHYIMKEDHLKLMHEVVDAIKNANLKPDEIIDLVRELDAEICVDIINTLISEKYLTEDEYIELDDNLTKIYEEEYISDQKDGTLEKRMAFKANKNVRPISRYEIVTIFFKNTDDAMLLWGKGKTGDELLLSLIKCYQELGVIKKANAMFKKQQESIEEVLTCLLQDIKALGETV